VAEYAELQFDSPALLSCLLKRAGALMSSFSRGEGGADLSKQLPENQEGPSWRQLESVIPISPDVEEVTSLSKYTLKRHYSDKIVRLSPRRLGMKLRDALAIANGTAA
jgi:hypothetical protein